MTKKAETARGALQQAERRISLYEREVGQESWKKDHDTAMRCLSFEATLELGVALYDFLLKIDEVFRDAELSRPDAYNPKGRKTVRGLLQQWLAPCDRVQKELHDLEAKGFVVTHASEFRARHAEAVWILQPAREALGHAAMVAARDRAVDTLREG